MIDSIQQDRGNQEIPFLIYCFSHPQCLIDIALNGLLTLPELLSGMFDSYESSRELLSNLIPGYKKIFSLKFLENIPLDYYLSGDNKKYQ